MFGFLPLCLPKSDTDMVFISSLNNINLLYLFFLMLVACYRCLVCKISELAELMWVSFKKSKNKGYPQISSSRIMNQQIYVCIRNWWTRRHNLKIVFHFWSKNTLRNQKTKARRKVHKLLLNKQLYVTHFL